jgi:hypothetical protein
MTASYVIGIDLGTTNSVVAYCALDADKPQLELLPVQQLVAADSIEARAGLPSFIHIAPQQQAGFKLPWQAPGESGSHLAVGEYARRQSAESPQRAVVGAKSWLANSRVDRRQPILPWEAPADVAKISPVEASKRYLEHLVSAWNHAKPDAPLVDQHVVLTVPASFDAAARDLTREAAIAAGLPEDVVLLEEPQAAVYAWLVQMGDHWRKKLREGDTLLVCDVGGGTTDLTLVSVAQEQGELVLLRKAVGNHLLVGGDNMDLALAHHVAQHFAQQGVKLDPWQSISLWHSCRQAKETLLAAAGPQQHTIALAGRGSNLIKGSVKVEIAREAASQLLVDGFFPTCAISDRPARRRASGFQEIGLPFEADTGITRHVAAFLSAHGDSPDHPVRPTHLLFNGGVFKADAFRTRMLHVLGQWFPGNAQPVPLAGEHDLENAVARGAAYYGWAKQRGGVRIRGGTARAYYVGIETSGLAVPGAPRPLKALCVVPFGMEEGTELNVPAPPIGLVVGEPAEFRFFSSAVRKTDQPGELVAHWSEDEIVETDSLTATLDRAPGIDEAYVPVQFQSRITELGVFELWCVYAATGGRWKLEFSVREQE